MSLEEYHKITTKELITISTKVRSLVNHFPEDGRYKEIILRNALRKFLPEKFSVGTGFVVKPNENQDYGQHLSSKQIDLLVYDNASPVLFKEGDFVIVTPDSVNAIIEVKTNLQNAGLRDIVRQANEDGQFIFSGKQDKTQPFFNGIFSYNGFNQDFNQNTFATNLNDGNADFLEVENYKKFKVNHICLNKDWFLKYWPNDQTNPHSLYNLEDLSFSFFISNLVDMLARKSVRRNNVIWYATDKELNRRKKF